MSNATLGRQGFGFWDVTHYPVGGAFRRFGTNEAVEDIQKLPNESLGATHSGTITRDGKNLKIVFGKLAVDPQP